MARNRSKAVIQDVPQVEEVPVEPKPVQPIAEHDKKVLALIIRLTDAVQALNGAIYPWKQIREDAEKLMG